MVFEKNSTTTFEKSKGMEKIQTGKRNAATMIEGSGKVALATKDANLLLSDVAWVPESTVNLISPGALMTKGETLQVDTNQNPNTFKLDFRKATHSSAELTFIHHSLGHASLSRMEKFLNTKFNKSQKRSSTSSVLK